MTTQRPQIIETRLGPVECLVRGEGPPIVSLHGAMGGWDQSDLLAQTIGSKGFRHIAVSRPGYLSTPITSGKEPEDQAKLLAALLDELGEDEATIFVVSGGGPCALHFALDFPKRCRALVLVSTVGGILDQKIPFAFTIMKTMAKWKWMANRMRQKVEHDFEKVARRSIPDDALRMKTLNDPQAGPLYRALTLSTFARMGERIPGTENDIRITRERSYPLERIGVPTLVIHGTADSVVPYEKHGKVLSERIPKAELLTIDGGEHVSIFTHRQIVQDRVAEFMKRVYQ